jgi:hypothetical protein
MGVAAAKPSRTIAAPTSLTSAIVSPNVNLLDSAYRDLSAYLW